MSFLNRGYDEADKAKKKVEEQRAAAGVFRWWMPVNDDVEKQITFIDGDHPPNYKEHNWFANNSWKNWATCLQGHKDENGNRYVCPACAAGNKPYFAVAYTIIDHSRWEDKQGKVHENEKKLLVVKDSVYPILKKQNKKQEGLAGCTYDVTRTSRENSANVGDLWEFSHKREIGELEEQEPYDYEKVLALNYDKLVLQFGDPRARSQNPVGSKGPKPAKGGKNQGGGGYGGQGGQEDDIPF